MHDFPQPAPYICCLCYTDLPACLPVCPRCLPTTPAHNVSSVDIVRDRRRIAPKREFCDDQIRKVVRSVLTFDDRRDSREWRDCATAYVDVSPSGGGGGLAQPSRGAYMCWLIAAARESSIYIHGRPACWLVYSSRCSASHAYRALVAYELLL